VRDPPLVPASSVKTPPGTRPSDPPSSPFLRRLVSFGSSAIMGERAFLVNSPGLMKKAAQVDLCDPVSDPHRDEPDARLISALPSPSRLSPARRRPASPAAALPPPTSAKSPREESMQGGPRQGAALGCTSWRL